MASDLDNMIVALHSKLDTLDSQLDTLDSHINAIYSQLHDPGGSSAGDTKVLAVEPYPEAREEEKLDFPDEGRVVNSEELVSQLCDRYCLEPVADDDEEEEAEEEHAFSAPTEGHLNSDKSEKKKNSASSSIDTSESSDDDDDEEKYQVIYQKNIIVGGSQDLPPLYLGLAPGEQTKEPREKIKKESKDLDAEVNDLCDFGALERGPRSMTTSEARLRAKSGKARSPAKCLADMSSCDEEDTDNSQGDMDVSEGSDQEDLNRTVPTENELAKKIVLATSSDSDGDYDDDDEEGQDSSEDQQDKSKGSGVAVAERAKKKDNRDALLRMKLDDVEIKREIKVQGHKSSKRCRNNKKIRLDDDNDSEESEVDETEDEETEDEETGDDEDEDVPLRGKKRKKAELFSSESSDEDENEAAPTKKSRKKKERSRRRNIRRILTYGQLSEATQKATFDECQRRQRMVEKDQLFNQIEEDPSLGSLTLDVDGKTKEILVKLDPKIVQHLKPHQKQGIKFMWDSVFESTKEIEANRAPGGCILSHFMGLGKTLQTIALVHTVMTQFLQIKTCLILTPLNCQQNWKAEFNKWLGGSHQLKVWDFSEAKSVSQRLHRLKKWHSEGGVAIMGYAMFSSMTMGRAPKKDKKVTETKELTPQEKDKKEHLLEGYRRFLWNPAIVVCDEGHILKNAKTNLSKAVSHIRTPRRIILTGTPMMNNLEEYFVMVNFVKPSLLGTLGEFNNQFTTPIQNGQHLDSNPDDVNKMKERSFVLNDLLQGCMQRQEFNVLVPYLQPKLEFVLSICLTDLQKRLYKYFLTNVARCKGKKGLFDDHPQLSKLCNHPCLLKMGKSDKQQASTNDAHDSFPPLDEGVPEIDDDERYSSEGETTNVSALPQDWWHNVVLPEERIDELEIGAKMVLLLDIIQKCEAIGDKILVFSQSLHTLDLIETFLNASPASGIPRRWNLGKDYVRMQGKDPAGHREKWVKQFNEPSNTRLRLFLISTRAGGIGINLCAANRVVIFDVSWNPANDMQAIFRVYRMGQKKPVYVYRLMAKGTIEEKIYDRQVSKLSTSARVVDKHQIKRHFFQHELSELYEFNDEPAEARPTPNVPRDDRLLADMLTEHPKLIWRYHEHDSLLENRVEEELTEEERKKAWENYEKVKKQSPVVAAVPASQPSVASQSSGKLAIPASEPLDDQLPQVGLQHALPTEAHC